MKRLGTGLGIAAVFIVITATAAFANHGMGSGSTVCNPDGTITYSFSVISSGSAVGAVTTRLGNGPTPFSASETLPGSRTTDSLEWHITFHENNGGVIHGHGTITVSFDGTCTPSPSPSPSHTTPPPTTTPPTSPPPTHHSSSPSTTHVRGTGGTHHVRGTAFTGSSNTTPAAAAGMALLIVGLGLMWVARQRAR
jgi:LPXTG-motif cell wall-anchored protein